MVVVASLKQGFGSLRGKVALVQLLDYLVCTVFSRVPRSRQAPRRPRELGAGDDRAMSVRVNELGDNGAAIDFHRKSKARFAGSTRRETPSRNSSEGSIRSGTERFPPPTCSAPTENRSERRTRV